MSIVASLNTLSGGHPLRTGLDGLQLSAIHVSIPSQAGTLFGRPTVPPRRRRSSSQYPLRRAPSSDLVGFSVGSPYWRSQYPLRRAPSSDLLGNEVLQRYVSSQYPLRRAPSSDLQIRGSFGWSACRLNTLSGGHPLRTRTHKCEIRQKVGLNTLSGGHPLRTCPRMRGLPAQ